MWFCDSTIFYVLRTGAILCVDTNLRLEVLANLLHLYDDSWSLETEGARVVVGHNYYNMQQQPDLATKPVLVKRIRKWLKLAELGHLVTGDGSAANLVEAKRFPRLVTGLMDRLEHKLGVDGVRARVRVVASNQMKNKGKENLRSPKMSKAKFTELAAGPNPTKKMSSTSSGGGGPLASVPDNEAEVVPPATGRQIPRTPVTQQPPESYIPQGNTNYAYDNSTFITILLSQGSRFHGLLHRPRYPKTAWLAWPAPRSPARTAACQASTAQAPP